MLKTYVIGKIKFTVTRRCVKVLCEEVTQLAPSYLTIRRQSINIHIFSLKLTGKVTMFILIGFSNLCDPVNVT